ncbi:hypothetical protein J2W25_005688 [Variovorax boronicumulans]|uniref:Uncharacterized protein n=1 Tax=Variovorax boronicumulans TaxID=436515 RepID=A0AAW8E5N2_9BURK|nr:hypothetical protein [Variovorax boronicumulans]MDP9926639.1 hypothetical protein [Variovorax boronicumulans]
MKDKEHPDGKSPADREVVPGFLLVWLVRLEKVRFRSRIDRGIDSVHALDDWTGQMVTSCQCSPKSYGSEKFWIQIRSLEIEN